MDAPQNRIPSSVLDGKSRFSSRVKDYVAYRPSYPLAAIEQLDKTFDLPHGARIVDIGSGTGISAKALLVALEQKNPHVVGIEPNKDMREAGDEYLKDHVESGTYTATDGTAEATGVEDKSVDLVVACQAFHWFDIPIARAECQRILKDNGKAGVALIWNDRRGVDASAPKSRSFPRLDSPIMNAYDLLLVNRGQKYKEVNHHHTVNEDSLKSFFGPKGFRMETFENPYRLTFEQLKGRLLSSSYSPQEGEPGFNQMIAELKHLFEKCQTDGKIDFIYDTRVFYGVIS